MLEGVLVTPPDVSHLIYGLITWNNKTMKYLKINNTPVVSGIDALYYFVQTGTFYDHFYDSLLEQIETKKAYFTSLNYAYADNDIIITINEIDITYSGMGRDGFHWFNHQFFRVGFKDPEKAMNIHNIRVQLNAVGIYTLGIKSLLQYINKEFLPDCTTKHYPVTRIDLNMFVQHSFTYLRKEMIVSKKKNHSATIGERSSGYELETYYIGKKPFLVRIYNKLKELQSASPLKRELMLNYFGINGLDIEKPIFNVEFELHREYLKTFGIDTIGDALERSETLFKEGCKLIRLIDVDSISEKQLLTSNRKRADTLPIWEHIKNSYKITEFLQLDTPMDKVEKIGMHYSLDDARASIKRIVTRLLIHGNSPTSLYFMEILQNAKEDFELRGLVKSLHEEHKEKLEQSNKFEYEKFVEELPKYSTQGLQALEKQLTKEMDGVTPDNSEYDRLTHQMIAVSEEYNSRFEDEIPF